MRSNDKFMGELDKTKLIQNTSNSPNTWKKSISVYFDKRIAVIFLLGFSSGLPLALTLGTLSIWLSRSGIDKTTIGLFSAVSLPYVFKFVWAPIFM